MMLTSVVYIIVLQEIIVGIQIIIKRTMSVGTGCYKAGTWSTRLLTLLIPAVSLLTCDASFSSIVCLSVVWQRHRAGCVLSFTYVCAPQNTSCCTLRSSTHFLSKHEGGLLAGSHGDCLTHPSSPFHHLLFNSHTNSLILCYKWQEVFILIQMSMYIKKNTAKFYRALIRTGLYVSRYTSQNQCLTWKLNYVHMANFY